MRIISITKKTCLSFGLAGLLFTLSCTKELDFNDYAEDKQYVINSLFKVGDLLDVYVYKTQSLNSNNTGFTVVRNLNICLYEGSNKVDEATLIEDSVYRFSYYPSTGVDYKIIVTDTLNNVSMSASDLVPKPVPITKADYYSKYAFTDEYELKYNRIYIEFTDEPKTDNYYEVLVVGNDALIINHPAVSYNNNDDAGNKVLFSDELFKDKTLRLSIYAAYVSNTPTIKLRNVSKIYYDYFKSLTTHLHNQNVLILDDRPIDLLLRPLPTELYSNVENGLGVFAAYAETSIRATKID